MTNNKKCVLLTTLSLLVTHVLKADCMVLCRLDNDAETNFLAQQTQKLTICSRLPTYSESCSKPAAWCCAG